MTTVHEISPHLIRQFNEAAGLSREGNYKESLAAWDTLINGDESNLPRIATGDFLGQAHMRRAWVLMDLGRHQDALSELTSDFMQACLGQFSMPVLYEYFFSLANTQGNLVNVEAMDDAFSRAMGIAAEELGDPARVAQCWFNLMTWASEAEAWDYILREVPNAITFAKNVGVDDLEALALEHLATAQSKTRA
ncbi:MAG: hypothetical protein ACYTDT_12420 [Planctomycetota bacterium]|jgi:tetratricopeptide (TPR) repeat protein